MAKINKRSINKIGNRIITGDNVKIAILFIPLCVLLIREIERGEFVVGDFFDTSVLISFLIVFICEAIAMAITNYINKKTEDDMKLDVDYQRLVKKYPLDHNNMISASDAQGETVLLPALRLCARRIDAESQQPFALSFKQSERKKYVLPKQVTEYATDLFGAHEHSTVYNNTNIRLDDLIISSDTNQLTLCYSFTTYFDSLITNRAMDYPLDELRTIREIYEPGPMLSTLPESKLSNHLGFNGFVELSDGKIIFVYRGKDVSIAKQQWAQSIGASLKTAYCLNAERKLDAEGLSRAIRKEIFDELKIEVPEEENLCNSIFAFYRDIVEGGKPQFLFYYKAAGVNSASFLAAFNLAMADKNAREENKARQIVDGEKFAFLTIDELRQSKIEMDRILLPNGKEMHMMPSSLASIALLLESY